MTRKTNEAWYDPEVDILNVVKPKKVKHSIDVDNIVVDIGYDGLVTGVEILDAKDKLGLNKEQLCSLKEASMRVTYKQNCAYIFLVFIFEKVENEVKLPVTIELGKGHTMTEKAEFGLSRT